MRSWAFMMFMFAFIPGVLAQYDNTATKSRPWVELTGGIKTPAGSVGIGIGVPICIPLTVVGSAGYAQPEGYHLSTGAELLLRDARVVDISAFSYWTWTMGREDRHAPLYGSEIGSGQMVKAGATVIVFGNGFQFVLRAGYSILMQTPEWSTYGGGSHEHPIFENGPLLGVSLRFPFNIH